MRKAIIILTPGFPENEADTQCLPPQQTFVRALQELEPARQVIVLSFVYPFFSGRYDWHGVKVLAFGKESGGVIHRKLTYARVWLTLKKLMSEYEVQGLLSFWFGPCAWLGLRFSRRYGYRFHCWLLGQDARPGNKFVRKANPDAQTLIALSDAVSDEFEKNYGTRPAFTVPPGVDPTLFDPPPPEKDIDLIAVGSLIPLKQFHLFIEVVAALQKDFPSLRAVVCGGGPLQQELERQAIQAGLSETEIRFTGRQDHKEVLKLMQRSRLLLHPSSYEGFGVVQLEALYAGAGVLSFVKPMHGSIEGWTTVKTTAEMIRVTADLLSRPRNQVVPRLPFPIAETAVQINQFFDSSSIRTAFTGSALLPGETAAPAEAGTSAAAIS